MNFISHHRDFFVICFIVMAICSSQVDAMADYNISGGSSGTVGEYIGNSASGIVVTDGNGTPSAAYGEFY